MRHSGQELSIEVDGSWRNLTVDPDASGFDPGFRRQMRDIYSLLQVMGFWGVPGGPGGSWGSQVDP